MKRPRALIADDDPDRRDVVGCILDRFGIDAVCVALGGELDKLADDGPFDVIVMDVATPWLTGVHVIHAARIAGVTCPVIVMTMLGVTHEQVVALGQAVHVLRKPFSLAQLEAALIGSLGAALQVDVGNDCRWRAPWS
jgi:DNA-binding response OmpR family regulator